MTAARTPAEHEQTLDTVVQARSLALLAVRAEKRETGATSEHPDWSALNEAKWAAYEEAAEVIPGSQDAYNESEEQFLAILNDVAFSTDHALARKWGLPW